MAFETHTQRPWLPEARSRFEEASVRSSTLQPALRPVPEADGLDPSMHPVRRPQPGTRRYHLLWHQREVQSLGGGNLRLRVPLLGPAPTADLTMRLDAMLTRLWVGRSFPQGITITSVVTDVQQRNETINFTAIIGTAGIASRHRVDNAGMARDLRFAFHRATCDHSEPAASAPDRQRATEPYRH